MKRTFLFCLLAVALGFMACSEEDISVADSGAEGGPKGMVLRATVEQTAETRATISSAWLFDFAKDDVVSVTNTEVTAGTYYTFTNDGTQFTSADAEPTASAATWYAYFPSHEIDLTGQSGSKADVAGKYALAGATTEATTGEDGLSITLSPKVAILVIKNYKGVIDINVKNSGTTWVSGLAAHAAGFDVTTATSQQNLLSVTETGTYYVAVPAGVQLAVKDGTSTIKSTGTNGLTAGRYYELAVEASFGQGMTKATINSTETDVRWVQLWAGGPKFAEYNVGVTDGQATSRGSSKSFAEAVKTGADFAWGANWRTPTKNELDELLLAATEDGSEKVACVYEQVNGVWGFTFTGKEEGYTANSVFFPVQFAFSNTGYANYWSGTAEAGCGCRMYLYHTGTGWQSSWMADQAACYVRPVLNDTPATTGVATATINGADTYVNWVQLWAGGPKFAEYNVGVTDGDVLNSGKDYEWANNIALTQWGSNWRMPTKAEYEALIANCTCTLIKDNSGTGILGFLFTGTGAYAANNVFFHMGGEYCWSTTQSGYDAMYCLYFVNVSEGFTVRSTSVYLTQYVRAVLAE